MLRNRIFEVINVFNLEKSFLNKIMNTVLCEFFFFCLLKTLKGAFEILGWLIILRKINTKTFFSFSFFFRTYQKIKIAFKKYLHKNVRYLFYLSKKVNNIIVTYQFVFSFPRGTHWCFFFIETHHAFLFKHLIRRFVFKSFQPEFWSVF